MSSPKIRPFTRAAPELINVFEPVLILLKTMEVLDINNEVLISRSKKLDMVDARCIIAWLCYKYSPKSGMGVIGRLIRRDRTTAIHMVQRANNFIETEDKKFTEKLCIAEHALLTFSTQTQC